MFDFKLEATDGLARAGTFTTPHGDIQTPVFMPCGTQATVKTMAPHELEEVGAQIILGNNYHLHLRPGSELIRDMGGLHKWMKWDKPILTDSGGFQVFSLNHKVKIKEDGVQFNSHIDGSKHFFTPESVIQTQVNLGSDIMMVLDECAPGDSDHRYARQAMKRTHEWAKQSVDAFKKLADPEKQTMFPIVQGVIFDDLRAESAKYMASLDTKGVAIGGLSVGESTEDMYRILDVVNPHLPTEKPRYLMGVGKPENIVEGVYRGIDMFDCVHATRLGRHGCFWDYTGRHSIKNAGYSKDDTPLLSSLNNFASSGFSKSYIHHLIKANEVLGIRLLSMHNLAFLFDLTAKIRQAVIDGRFEEFRKEFYDSYKIKK